MSSQTKSLNVLHKPGLSGQHEGTRLHEQMLNKDRGLTGVAA